MPVDNYDRQAALELATKVLPVGTSAEDVVKAAAILTAFIAGEEAEAEETPVPEVKRVEFWRVEYTNRKSEGTHWGRVYKTEKGANKNSKNPAFLRAVRFVETD